MYWLRRFTIFLTVFFLLSFVAWYVPRVLDPTNGNAEKRAKDRQWVASSPYFFDRQACRWIGLCGLHHLRKDPANKGNDWEDDYEDDDRGGELRKRADWDHGVPPPNTKRNHHERRRVLKDVPDYVYRYAPLVHLYSGEEFWPSDIKEHVEHMTAYVDDDVYNSTDGKWSLHNLDQLNDLEGIATLHSNDDVETRPPWLHSHHNIPNPFEDDPATGGSPPTRSHSSEELVDREPTTWYDTDRDHPVHRISDPTKYGSHPWRPRRPSYRRPLLKPRGHKPDSDGYSQAPAVLILVDKGSGVLDAFWFFFYSYNLGQTVFGLRFGNHVGDWEHFMIRFEDGTPRGVFLSEHEAGQAYAWEAVEKSSTGRPVIYSAVGSHAMYPLPGVHPYVLPFKLLKDVTDKGPLWDPGLNNYAFHYDLATGGDVEDLSKTTNAGLTPAADNPRAPTSWFHFTGRWGDELYSLADPRQWRLFGQYHYNAGPIGPKFKSLGRNELCNRDDKCNVGYKLDPKRTWRD